MRIVIEYSSSWRNSFLDGNNNSSLPKKGREYLGSMTMLKREGSFIRREVTQDTVMGVLNRLIGDQRKLYQARGSEDYYFRELEGRVTFVDKPEFTDEVVYLRNMRGSYDRNSFTGMIKSDAPIFTSSYSKRLWGVLALEIEELFDLILEDKFCKKSFALNPLAICDRMKELEKVKPIQQSGRCKDVLEILAREFPDTGYTTAKGEVNVIALYCSALYLTLKHLKKEHELETALTSSGLLKGFSKRGFTKKDFMEEYTTGGKKIIWGGPYIKKEKVKGQGEVQSTLRKARGVLEIRIEADPFKAKELKSLIERAGVSAFYLGKKGLAYVAQIRI